MENIEDMQEHFSYRFISTKWERAQNPADSGGSNSNHST